MNDRKGRPWTSKELTEVRKLAEAGTSYDVIAAQLHRSTDAVARKVRTRVGNKIDRRASPKEEVPAETVRDWVERINHSSFFGDPAPTQGALYKMMLEGRKI